LDLTAKSEVAFIFQRGFFPTMCCSKFVIKK